MIRARVLLCMLVLLVACGEDPFEQRNVVSGLRILAARADLPYAKPGETVKIEALVHDGRDNPPEPGKVFWLPVPCIDPPGGHYYDCFPLIESAFPLGVDLTPQLHEGRDVTMTIPPDALANAKPVPGGAAEPSATAYVFLLACGGHVERVQRTTNLGANSMPLGCFDANRKRLDAVSSVFAFTRIAIFENRRNAPPVLENVLFHGGVVDRSVPIKIKKCEYEFWDWDWIDPDCDREKFDIVFPDSSAELDPDNIGPNGEPARETLWVDWYTSHGRFFDDRIVVWDPLVGRAPSTEIEMERPRHPGTGTIWAVLHDNRGGATWLEIPFETE